MDSNPALPETGRSRATDLGFCPDSVTSLRIKDDAVTWRCVRGSRSAILKCYYGDAAALSAGQRCRRSELAAAELREAGIPTPAVLAADPEGNAILFEDVQALPWSDRARRAAASVLRQLHGLSSSSLSAELCGLLAETEPNQERIALGVRMLVAELDVADPAWRHHEPKAAAQAEAIIAADEPHPTSAERRLIHGDYFRANLISTVEGVQVIDWDLFGLGDPAWDVAFLIGAEPGVGEAARTEALTAYGHVTPALERRLAWHIRCWTTFWVLRALVMSRHRARTTPVRPTGATARTRGRRT